MARTTEMTRKAWMAAVAMMMVMAGAASAQGGGGLTTLEQAEYGPYGAPVSLLVNSPGEWKVAMKKLEDAGALAVVPGPDVPLGVDWSKECVVLVASGSNGYDPHLVLTPVGNGNVKLSAGYTQPAGNSGGEALPYHLAKVNKRVWLKSMTVVGSEAVNALPLSGPDMDPSTPAGLMSWGGLKAQYR